MENRCSTCEKVLESPIQLIHQEKKKGKAKKCSECKSEFKKHRDLQRHLKNRKNIECTHCSRKFCSNEHFNQHLRTIKEIKKEVTIDLN